MRNIRIQTCFFVKCTDCYSQVIRFLKTDLNWPSSLLENGQSTYLVWSSKILKPSYYKRVIKKLSIFSNSSRSYICNIKNVDWPLSSKLDDKFKSVFRIIIALLLLCWTKNTSKLLCCACVRQRREITITNPL